MESFDCNPVFETIGSENLCYSYLLNCICYSLELIGPAIANSLETILHNLSAFYLYFYSYQLISVFIMHSL